MSKQGDAPTTERHVVPQEVALAFFGLCVFGQGATLREVDVRVPTQVLLAVLGRLGASDTATRAALNRMVNRGLLARHKDGRTSAFELTPQARTLLAQGRDRLFSPAPFDHEPGVWTVLSCPLPETLRNVRYQLQTRLTWAGFGAVQSHVWVAPGRVDVEAMIGDLLTADVRHLAQAFHGTPTAPSDPAELVDRAWDLTALRAAHEDFLDRWERAEPGAGEALPQLLLLIDDWGRLLRADPGLPAAQLPGDWPAARSAGTFSRLRHRLGPGAEKEIEGLLRPAA
ncbi:PaaX family transcriptional regulator C-terminal domain-containing protein [Streptomyces sp. NPDC091217]|uniref:PaaX family transcriptional regulator n=1 Tax=Streptomyces sp. NPDC091217 TaxID=3365975 RepID=UPI003805DA2F